MPRKPYISQTQRTGRSKKSKVTYASAHTPAPARRDIAEHKPPAARAKTTGLEGMTGKRIKTKSGGASKPKQPNPSAARGVAALRKATGT